MAARPPRPWPPARRSGLRAGYLGAIGGDDNGQRVRAELERRGVDVSQVLTRERPNRFAVIAVDNQTGERIVLWDRDARLNLSAAEIRPELIASARVVHVDDEDRGGGDSRRATRPRGQACT